MEKEKEKEQERNREEGGSRSEICKEQGKRETSSRGIDIRFQNRDEGNRDEGSKDREVRIKNANILCHISSNVHLVTLATDVRSLVRFAPSSHRVNNVSAGIAHSCVRTHLVVISGAQSTRRCWTSR